MRKYHEKVYPGARRIKHTFLFWPLRINDETRWLEVARYEEVYTKDNTWKKSQWVDLPKNAWDSLSDMNSWREQTTFQDRIFKEECERIKGRSHEVLFREPILKPISDQVKPANYKGWRKVIK